jgi:hypothetical protein
MRKSALIFLAAAACGGGGSTVDGPHGTESGGHSIKISGTATQQALTGNSPAPGVVVAAFKNSDENTAVTMATTAMDGTYSLTVMTDGSPLDGYLKATKTGNADTYLYPPAPLAMDFAGASVNELDTNLYDTLSTNTTIGCGNTGTQTLVVLEVFDTAQMPVAGVAVTMTPAAGKTGYSGANGLPDFTLTSTQADGRAFLCQVVAGAVTVTGTKTGATFKTTSLKARTGAFTTTIVSE